ncbi:hypothetical protein CXG81DRAFT_29496 [Caulochytrium protostelioides]|uniref:non-specific serine/threonine protein kinase n=1 Tax=Caulochytrium protostelioides TaxID=1555241 RepID=A0A4P9XBG2_9FUNG|nr:hypothetical protein CXG81DRAFT_29496 [Caulochytrium protostelioides]|eukprot:RKP02470.1 hypothetical protein CXG81DRAFT_29496 [Caulochytrium protostelioides]
MLSRVNSWRVNTSDFETIKVLATGAVGTVCLVRAKADSKVYAMKTLKKIDLLTRQEAGFFMEERNALVFAQNSQWITTLHAAFQDEDNLYLIMEYVSGGSLRNFMNSQESALNEDDVKFYVAEMVLALDELHKNNIIHRDVKPENSLIDSSGHIKLADFGSCIKLSDSNAKICSGDTVGTPEYVCPEILQANEGKYSYSREADWWSLGIITYELLFDDTPFYSDSLMGLYHNIIGHEQNFVFPEEREVSPECRDFLSKLIVSGDKRLGRNSTAEIKAHPWFKGINWDTIRTQTPPFVPELNGPDDTRYFEDEEDESKNARGPSRMPVRSGHMAP